MPFRSNSRRDWFSKVYRTFIRWSLIVSVPFLVLLFVLIDLHLIEDRHALAGAFCVLILFLSEQIHHRNKLLNDRLQEIERLATSVFESNSLQLHTLQDCVEDLNVLLINADEQVPLNIDHFGLDMTHAWDYVRDLLSKPIFDRTCYRLLMISSDVSFFHKAHEEIRDYSSRSGTQSKKVKAGFEEIGRTFAQLGKSFSFEIREYTEVPFMHGVRIKGPVDVCYVSVFRWEGKDFSKFKWGESKYYRILGKNQSASIFGDILKIFEGNFGHTWSSSTHLSSGDVRPARRQDRYP